MKTSFLTGIVLSLASGAAVAQQPLTFPGRSQTAGQQAVDTATCYAWANQKTHVNMAHESQRPPPPDKSTGASAQRVYASVPLRAPLPYGASSADAASAASAAIEASAASAPTVATAATAGSAALPASAATVAAASQPQAASGAAAGSEAIAGQPPLPPPPPPEPPMTRYWNAYAECMQRQGYYVR